MREEVGERGGIAQPLGRPDVEAEVAGFLVDRRPGHQLDAADRSRRSGDDGDEVDRRMGGQPPERRLGEMAAAEEDRPDRPLRRRGHASARAAFSVSAPSTPSSSAPIGISSSIDSR